MKNEELLEKLHWRYAVKKFDPQKKISKSDWETLEDALVLSPSSYGLQPWKFIVVTDQGLREKLKSVSFNQDQVISASHLVVFCAKKAITKEDVNHFIQRTADIQGKSIDALQGYADVMIGDLVNGPRSKIVDAWASRQLYIALGVLLTSAASLGIDACPMEGFNNAEYDKILGLTEKGFTSYALCTLGYRSSEDKYATVPKVRFPKEEVVEHRK